MTRAATPATTGVAADVPPKSAFGPQGKVVATPVPGAATSTWAL